MIRPFSWASAFRFVANSMLLAFSLLAGVIANTSCRPLWKMMDIRCSQCFTVIANMSIDII